jgi:3-methyladenine DNA glycosylase AlkD
VANEEETNPRHERRWYRAEGAPEYSSVPAYRGNPAEKLPEPTAIDFDLSPRLQPMAKASTPASTPRALIAELRARMRDAADPAKAPGMQRYMKSAMPYYGITTPIQRAINREVFERHPLASPDDWRDAVLTLWRSARRREERYAAIGLLAWRAYRPYRTLDTLPMLEEMIVGGAWWDLVDPLATHRLRELLSLHPKPVSRAMRAWSHDTDLWKRRSAILCQVGRKGDTDLALLFDCIEPNLADRGFFIRKAIGWALRDYAWHDLDTVETWVAANESRLSGLSRREALKNRDALRAGTARGGRLRRSSARSRKAPAHG